MTVGIYVHVPFCRTRCHFCAFSLQIHRDDWAARYLDAVSREIRLHAEQRALGGRQLDTIYFGGGTPTTLTAEQLVAILGTFATPSAPGLIQRSPSRPIRTRCQKMACGSWQMPVSPESVLAPSR